MAGEQILIVDDTPVNLKLTRILLVNEGFRVITAGSAEEALELLRSCHPRLILADIQLPGMDGLEMTRVIKQDERTRDIAVVALTAFAMKGDEQKAIAVGCDGYVTKPIDTRTLGDRIRGVLARKPNPDPSAAAPPPAREAIPAAEMQALRRRFLQEGEERTRRLLLDLDGVFDAGQAARSVHQWVGTGGLLGYRALARLAREVEELLRERPLDTAQVRESLTGLLLAFSSPDDASDIPVPVAIAEALSGKCIAIVDLPANETQRLCVALERARAHALFFQADEPGDSPALAQCDLVVAYVRLAGSCPVCLDPSAGMGGLPTVLVGNREELLAVDPAVQAMAVGFLMDSWQPEEALVRLTLALTHRSRRQALPPQPPAGGGPVRVLVADSDAVALSELRTTLEDSGMRCYLADDGPMALAAARDFRPEAALLDVNLSGIDGYQLLAAIRADNLPVRVILLTARRQESDILHGFTLGADDYVVKPFSPMELVSRLKRLVLP